MGEFSGGGHRKFEGEINLLSSEWEEAGRRKCFLVDFLSERDDVVPCGMAVKGKEGVSWHNHVESGAGASVVLEEYGKSGINGLRAEVSEVESLSTLPDLLTHT